MADVIAGQLTGLRTTAWLAVVLLSARSGGDADVQALYSLRYRRAKE